MDTQNQSLDNRNIIENRKTGISKKLQRQMQEIEIDNSLKDLDLKIAIIKEKALKLKKSIKTSN